MLYCKKFAYGFRNALISGKLSIGVRTLHTRAPHGVSFQQFCPLTVDDVISAVRRLPDKSSAADPIPTSVLKQIVDVIAPFITELFNRSIQAGHFPTTFKEAPFITPIVKKPGLDATSGSSYRPISNLPVLSKLLERLVVRQLMADGVPFICCSSPVFPVRVSARPFHRNCYPSSAVRHSSRS